MAKSGGDQQGQTLVFFALVAGLLLFALVALVGDYGITLSHYNQIDEAAVLGAQAGAAQVDLGAFQASGAAKLDQPAAVAECQRIIALDAKISAQGSIICTTGSDGSGDYVSATVSDQGMLVVRLLGSRFNVSSTHRSRPTYGTQVPLP